MLTTLFFSASLAVTATALPASQARTSHHRTHHAKRRNGAGHHQNLAGVRTIPVSFTVVNDNATAVPCLPDNPDGKTYTVSGSLILPAGSTPSGVTLYAHGLGYASWFWDFTAVPGYNYAGTEATRAYGGHASVAIDRLGYGSSQIHPEPRPASAARRRSCTRSSRTCAPGSYTAAGMATPPTFSKVGLVGHSAGGELAEIEAYTFKDINALGLMEWADQFYSVGTYTAFGEDALQCVAGNVKQVGSSETGYAKFGTTNAQFNSLMLADAAPAVVSAVDAMRRERPVRPDRVDPDRHGLRLPQRCHDQGAGRLRSRGRRRHLPGAAAVAAAPGGAVCRCPKVTDIGLPGEGHAVTLQRGARSWRRR